MEEITPGDCVLDMAGAIGIVLSAPPGAPVEYETTGSDAMKLFHHSPANELAKLGERFKRFYIREMYRNTRRLYRANEEGDQT